MVKHIVLPFTSSCFFSRGRDGFVLRRMDIWGQGIWPWVRLDARVRCSAGAQSRGAEKNARPGVAGASIARKWEGERRVRHPPFAPHGALRAGCVVPDGSDVRFSVTAGN
jgi:hypothetical protein